MMHARLCELGDAIDTHFALSRRMELEEEITFFGGANAGGGGDDDDDDHDQYV